MAETLQCAGCLKGPEETHGWVCEEGQTAIEYVWDEEGTLDRATGKYLCDDCYIKFGQPAGYPGFRWTATPQHLREIGIKPNPV